MHAMSSLDIARIREDFPILAQPMRGKPLVFLDSAASSQKPRQVLDAMHHAYTSMYANVHRGLYELSENATAAYDDARLKVARFINAPSENNIVFTKNATEAFNLLAYSYARAHLREGDEIIITQLEHHANFVPWLILAKERGIVLKYWRVTDDGYLRIADLEPLLNARTKIVSMAHVSNVLGTITDPRPVAERAHAVGAVLILDAAQSVPHMPVDVQALDCDFLCFSGHKMLGPTGIGVLYGKSSLLERMPPFLAGGDMITQVRFDGADWAAPPLRFEAGTPPFVEAIGLGAAIDYLSALGMSNVAAHEHTLMQHALDRLSEVPGVHIVGPQDAQHRGGAATFTMNKLHPHDVAWILDQQGIAVRAGLHCAHPLHERLGLEATTRASFYVYTQPSEIDALIDGLYAVRKYFSR